MLMNAGLTKMASSVQAAVWVLMVAAVGAAGIVRARVESAAIALHDTADGAAACVLVNGPHSLPKN